MKRMTSGLLICLSSLLAVAVPTSAAELGQTVVDNYWKSSAASRKPGGDCYNVAYKRINDGVKQACGTNAALPSLSAFEAFDRLWASKTNPTTTWLQLDKRYRGKGAAGAMAFQGMGDLIDQQGIWSGKLKPGAIVQTWRKRSDFDRVFAGKSPEDIGHSFIFLEYVLDAKKVVTGMKIGDQGTPWDAPKILEQATFDYWVAANIKCAQ